MKKFIILSLSAVTALLTSACGEMDCQGHYTYDSSFSDQEVLWIQNSSYRWNTFVGRTVVSISKDSKDYCQLRIGNLDGERDGRTSLDDNVMIIDTDRMREIGIYGEQQFETVVAHELGHSMGFRHNDGPKRSSIMNATGGPKFTQVDRDQCRALGICQ